MKRMAARVRMVLVLLAGGAIVNVAVAWGLYLWRPFTGHPFRPTTSVEAQRVWDRAWPPGSRFADDHSQRRYDPRGQFTATPSYRIVFVGHGLTQLRQREWPDGSAWEFQAGWPARSLVAHRRQSDNSTCGLIEIKNSWIPIRKDGSPIMDDYLPYRPGWPGFAINTIFYAAVLWGLFALGGAPFALRRRLRIKRGLCPKCAYPVGANEVCTECGAAITRRAAAS